MYKKRFNAILISLLFLIAFVGGIFAAYGKSEIVNAIEEEIVVGDDNLPPSEQAELPDGLSAPAEDATAYERLDFAFKILANGAGYTSYSAQVITVVGQVQNIVTKRYRGNNYDLTEEYYRYDGIMSVGKNEFASYYSDNVNMKSKRSQDRSKYDFATKTYDYSIANDRINSFTVSDWENTRQQLKLNSFFTTVNADTSKLLSYDNKGRNKTYYTIKVDLYTNKLDKKFVNLFAAQGISNLKIESIEIEFKIDKNTGYLLSYAGTGILNATWGITARVQVDMKETYFTMNASAEKTIKTIASKSFGITF